MQIVFTVATILLTILKQVSEDFTLINGLLLKVKYLFSEIDICMGSVIDLNEWRNNSMRRLVCAIPGCPHKPTNRCPSCSVYYCYDHVKSHPHMVNPEDIQKNNINKMR